MTLSPGTRLGPYEIVAPIGAGGMGEVFKARDTRLDRSVAIKLLPTEFSHDAKLRLRFEREAKTISQLNHPHVCTLYDVGREDGRDYLVMELLEGETLAERLSRGPLPLAEVTRYGAQIADALAKAHRQGIVHRDLKPANIMITRSGAKLLDFGLSKMAPAAAISIDGATEHKPLTREGTILGTFQYMAPEQLEGVEADARTDIFALGAVLYEAATGNRAFEGATKTSLIAAIVSSDPKPISQIQPLTPPALEHVIRKCLEKHPDDRWQSAHDVAEELKWISEAGSQAGVAVRVTRRRKLVWPVMLTLIVLTAVAAWFAARRFSRAEPEVVQFKIDIPNVVSIALSPDGRTLAYADSSGGKHNLWTQSFSEEAPRRLLDTQAHNLFWSPDGATIGFLGEDTLKAIPVDGGSPRTICDAPNAGVPTWGSKGTILFAVNGSVMRVSERGGEPAVVLRAEPEIRYSSPVFLPDGDNFLVVVSEHPLPSDSVAAWRSVASLSSRKVTNLFQVNGGARAAYAEPGYLFYRSGDKLMARGFDDESLQLTGEATVVRDGVTSFVVATNGTIAYRRRHVEAQKQLVALDRQGRELRPVGVPAPIWHLSLAPDERHVAIEILDVKAGTSDVWTRDIATGRVTTRLTFTPKFEWMMTWSPDASRLFFASNQSDNSDVYSIPRGGGTPALTYKAAVMQAPMDVSRDGAYMLVYDTSNGLGNADVKAVPIAGGPAITVAATQFNEKTARFSPDGNWVVYDSDKSGRSELYLQDFPAATKSIQISSEGGSHPAWSADGRELYYAAGEKLVALSVEQLSPEPRLGEPVVLFKFPPGEIFHGFARYPYAPAKNGREFYVLKEISARIDSPIHIVLNATSALASETSR